MAPDSFPSGYWKGGGWGAGVTTNGGTHIIMGRMEGWQLIINYDFQLNYHLAPPPVTMGHVCHLRVFAYIILSPTYIRKYLPDTSRIHRWGLKCSGSWNGEWIKHDPLETEDARIGLCTTTQKTNRVRRKRKEDYSARPGARGWACY